MRGPIFLILLLFLVGSASAQLAGFSSMQQVNVTGSTIWGANQTGYEVTLNLYSGSGTTSGKNVYLNGHSQQFTSASNWADIRVTDGSDNVLPIWFVNTSANATFVPVKVNVSTIYMTGNTTLRVQYGNATVSSVSSTISGNVAPLFDHFDTAMNTSLWSVVAGSPTFSNSLYTSKYTTGFNYITSIPTYGINYSAEMYGQPTSIGYRTIILQFNEGTPVAWFETNNYYAGHVAAVCYNGGTTTKADLGTSYTGNHIWEIWRNGTTDNEFFIDGIDVFNGTSNFGTSAGAVLSYSSSASSDVQWNWIDIHKKIYPEPSFNQAGAWNGEVYLGTSPSFTTNVSTGPSPLSVQFTDTSDGSPTSWYWDFGDSNTSTDQNPAHTYYTAGTYAVKFEATNSYGGVWNNQTSITALASVTGTYNWSYKGSVAGYSGSVFESTANALIFGNYLVFDSNTASYMNVTTMNLTTGQLNTTLSISRDAYSNLYHIHNYSGTLYAIIGSANYPTYTTTIRNSTDGITWGSLLTNYPGITGEDMIYYNASSLYLSGYYSTGSGTYTTVVNASNNARLFSGTSTGSDDGCFMVKTNDSFVAIGDAFPQNIIYSLNGVSFVDQYDSATYSATYPFDWGWNPVQNGSLLIIPSYNYIYGNTNAGMAIYNLTTLTYTPYILNKWLTSATVSPDLIGGTDANWSHTGDYTSDAVIYQYYTNGTLGAKVMDFAQNSSVISMAYNTTSDKVYAIIESKTDGKLYIFEGTQSQAPLANFTANQTAGTSPLDVSFTDTSTNTPTSWLYDFGDGNTSTDQNPTHVFYTGNWSVNLTSTNSAGSNTSASQWINVTAGVVAPVANFTATPTTGTEPLDVTFTDTSTNTPTLWLYQFGDGNTSTDQNPTHIYYVGNWSVNFSATNSAGTDWKNGTWINVSAAPTPTPTPTPTPIPTSGNGKISSFFVAMEMIGIIFLLIYALADNERIYASVFASFIATILSVVVAYQFLFGLIITKSGVIIQDSGVGYFFMLIALGSFALPVIIFIDKWLKGKSKGD